MYLIDFGLAVRASQSTQLGSESMESLEGTLAYIAPELSGRMNRTIDTRSDLYSLGVTLYEMLTGALPFSSSDPVELLHSHIARTPRPLQLLRPELPEVLSDIVLKLMSKMAEDRYHSAAGLRNDLEECLRGWQSSRQIPRFALGRNDRPQQLRMPQKLYGRSQELAQLDKTLGRVRGGAVELLLLSGPAGMGKTSLIGELAQSLNLTGGYLVRGRFDAQQQWVPYGPLLRACRELVRMLLTKSAQELRQWKERLISTLGNGAQLLADLLPELTLIIGEQPPAPSLPPVESQNRFGLLFQNFLRLFASAQEPLVLFLDDLQWADPASLQLTRLLLTDPYGHHLLVIGSYREQAMDSAHPVLLLLEHVRKEQVPITTLALTPWKVADILELLEDALGMPAEKLTELAEEILRKTHGSPFFVNQFLTALYRDGLLTFSTQDATWHWDTARIRSLTATDNVADFMVTKLQQLSSPALELLQIASCMGYQFDRHSLARIAGLSPAACAAGLSELVRYGLLIPVDPAAPLLAVGPSLTTQESDQTHDSSSGPEQAPAAPASAVYKFLHERVQHAAYITFDDARRQEIHVRLGRLRLSEQAAEIPTSDLFELVNHFNLGRRSLSPDTQAPELLKIAQLNLTAGLRAKDAAAFENAASFFATGVAVLTESDWELHHDLAFQLSLERAHCDGLIGRFDDSSEQLKTLFDRAHSRVERGLIHLRRCELHTTRADFAGATELGLQGLRQLEIPMAPLDDGDPQVVFQRDREEIKLHLAGRSIGTLVSLPDNRQPEVDVAVKLIVALAAPAYIAGSPLYPALMARQITLAIRYGISAETSYACASYAFLLGTVFGEAGEAYEFGQLALALLERTPNLSNLCRIHVALGAFYHFCRPMHECIALLDKAGDAGVAAGDFAYLSLSCSNRAQFMPYAREDFKAAIGALDEHLILLQRTKDVLVAGIVRNIRQSLLALSGRTQELTSLSDEQFDEAAVEAQLRKDKIAYPLLVFSWLKLMLLYIAGKHEEASALAIESEPLLAGVPGLSFTTEHTFFMCLALIARCAQLPAPERPAYEERIERYHAQLRVWVGHAPINYQHRERLVAAERASLAGQHNEAVMLYEAAIVAAQENGFPLHAALAHELAGRFHATGDRVKLASFYLTEAFYLYLRLGALGKAKAMLAQYPDHLRAETRTMQDITSSELSMRSTTSSGSHPSAEDHLDVNAVLRATELISRERRIDKVIEQVLYTVLSSSGTQRGFLILDRAGTLQIEAARTISPDSSRIGLSIPIDGPANAAGHGEDLACSVVHYVVRTREVITLSSAVPDARFASDPYLLRAKPRAVLCLPLVNQGRLTGILYLENNLAQVTFSAGRLDLLRILAAQAATALENALLLDRIHEATDKVRRTNEVLEQQVTERTADMQRSNVELHAANQRLQVELTERSKAERERAALQEQMLQTERARAELQEQMLRAQSERLAELSTPLIPITESIMVMPLVGSMDSERANQIMDAALNGAAHSGAKVVILDITGLRHMDTSIADSLLKTARALRLLGAHAILTGIRTVVAQTLVGLGVDLSTLETRSTLQSGIAFALHHTKESMFLK